MARPSSPVPRTPKSGKPPVGRGVIVLAAFVILLLASRLGFQIGFQDRLLYPPNRYIELPTPSRVPGSRFVQYTTPAGEERWGYRVDPGPAASPVPEDLPDSYILIYGGGSSANLAAPVAERLAALTGASFFIVEHRGHGFNDGQPDAEGLVADAVEAYDMLRAQGDFQNGVGVMGHSRGAGVALALAQRRPVDRLLLLSAATSLKDIAAIRRGTWTSLILREDWPNERRLRRLLQRPGAERPAAIGIIHGANDRAVPVWMARQLAAVSPEEIQLRIYEHQGHNDILDKGLEDVARFIRGGPLVPAPNPQ